MKANKKVDALIKHLGLKWDNSLEELSCPNSDGITNRVGILEKGVMPALATCNKCGAVYAEDKMIIEKVIENVEIFSFPRYYNKDEIVVKHYCPRCKKPNKVKKG